MSRWLKVHVMVAFAIATAACGGTADPDVTSSTSAATAAPTGTIATSAPAIAPTSPDSTAPEIEEPATEDQVFQLLEASGWDPRVLFAGQPFKWRATRSVEITETDSVDRTPRLVETELSGQVEGGAEHREYSALLDTTTHQAAERVIIGNSMWDRIGVSTDGLFYSATNEPEEQDVDDDDIARVALLGMLDYGRILYEASPDLHLVQVDPGMIGTHPATHYRAVIRGDDGELLVEAEMNFWVSSASTLTGFTYSAKEVEQRGGQGLFAGEVTRLAEFELYDVGIPVAHVVAPGSDAAEVDFELVVLAELDQFMTLAGLGESLTPTDALADVESLCSFMASEPPPLSEDIFDEMGRLSRTRAEALDEHGFDSGYYAELLFLGTDLVCPDLPQAPTTTTSPHDLQLEQVVDIWNDRVAGTAFPTLPNDHVTANDLLIEARIACAQGPTTGAQGLLLQLIVGATDLAPAPDDPMTSVIGDVLFDVAADIECPEYRDELYEVVGRSD